MSELLGFVVGIGAGLVFGAITVVWLIGTVARTFAAARIFKSPVVGMPLADRGQAFERVSDVDSRGQYIIKKKDKTRVFRIDPRHVLITKDNTRFSTILPSFSMNVTPEHAKLAERREKGEKNPTLKIEGETIGWHSLERQIKEWMGPGQLAGIMSLAVETHHPLKTPRSLPGGLLLKVGLVLLVVLVVGGVIFLAKQQGWI